MKRTIIILLGLFCINMAFGQFPMYNTGPATFEPLMGAWAEYKITGENAGKIKFSVVGEKDDNFWYEFVTTDDETGDVSKMKILTSGDPTKQQQTLRFVTQQNDETPMEMIFTIDEEDIEEAEEMAADMEESDDHDPADYENPFDELGVETITVPAGTFECLHTVTKEDNKTTGEYWVSEKVHFMGLVKATDDDGGTMELLAYGNEGAKSEITGKPEVVEVPQNSGDVWKMMGESAKEGAKEGAKEAAKEEAKDAVKEGIKGGMKSILGF